MSARPIRFGEFRLDPLKRELRRGDQLVELPIKAFACLAYLLSHRDRAVGREELIAAVWGHTVISDNLLDQMVLQARRAVGDTARQRRVIRTIPHFGYSWIAAVDTPEAAIATPETSQEPTPFALGDAEHVASADENPVAQEAPKSSAAPRQAGSARAPASRRPWLVLAAVLLAVLMALLLVGLFFRIAFPFRAIGSTARLGLVLPVAVTGDPSMSWVRLGAMELIAERLRRDGQPVIPSDSVVALAQGVDTAAFDPAAAATFARTADVGLVFGVAAESVQGRWRVLLKTVHGRAPPLVAEAASENVLVAAGLAADRMAERLGLAPQAEADAHPLDEELIRRAQAALLEDRVDEARTWLARIPADSSHIPDARYLQGRIDLKAGRYDEARTVFAAVAEIHATAEEPVLHARALYGIATAYFRQADLVSAARYFDEAVALLEGSRDPDAEGLLGRVLTLRGYNAFRILDQSAADKDFARARLLLESSGDQIGLMQLDLDVGAAAVNTSRFADAVPLLEQAARRAAAVHDVGSELRASVELARVRVELAEPAAALALDKRLQDLLALVQEPKLKRFVNAWRAKILAINGRLSEANDALALALFNRAVDEGGTAPSFAAALAWESGDFDRAIAQARTAIEVPIEGQDPRDTAVAWLMLLRSQIAAGQWQAAAATSTAISAWTEAVVIAPVALYEKLGQAEFAAAHLPEESNRKYQEAWALANEQQVPSELLCVADSYVRYLIRTHDPVTASPVAARLAGWADRDYDAALLQVRIYHALQKRSAWAGALEQARTLAGERVIPVELTSLPPNPAPP